MREYDVTCADCGERYRVNEPMLETLREDGCALCLAPIDGGTTPA